MPCFRSLHHSPWGCQIASGEPQITQDKIDQLTLPGPPELRQTYARRCCHENLNWQREVPSSQLEFTPPSRLAMSGTLRLGGRGACGGM
jgi:hypothetical protein